MRREAGNRGSFYPYDCMETERMIELFSKKAEEVISDKDAPDIVPRAIISPHAGYIYSGFTANIAHRILANAEPKRVVVVGPSHHVYFEGISGSDMESFETPCGDIPIDREYLYGLSSRHELLFVPEAHKLEHSTETQMPFIRHYCSDAKVVELIYGGRYDYRKLSALLSDILADPDSAIVISSDLSHFYDLKKAESLDRICLSGVAQMDTEILDRGCEACGIIGIKAIIKTARDQGYRTQILDYRTSADASGDESRVVGYMSAAIY